MDELKNAMIRFQLGISDKELKVFLQRLDEDGKGFISQSQFIKRFWSAYTYENVFEDEEAPESGKPMAGGKAGGLSEQIKNCKMFAAI